MQAEPNDAIEHLLAQMTAKLAENCPGVNRAASAAALRSFLSSRAQAMGLPAPDEVSAYLAQLLRRLPKRSAYAEFSHLQIAAAFLWGTQPTAFFAKVLRSQRVTKKAARQTEWDRARRAITGLPQAWQAPMNELLQRSCQCSLHPRGLIWSATRIKSVADALRRWSVYCDDAAIDPCPTGAHLEAYAAALRATGDIGSNSISDYLGRIVTGYQDVIQKTAALPGAAFVVARRRELKGAPTTKTQSQIVGASVIANLARDLFAEARHRPIRSLAAAVKARDAVLLLLAISLPERSRALSALSFDETLHFGTRPWLHFDFPGAVLKGLQIHKAGKRRRVEVQNSELWDMLSEYRTAFRPLFDDGQALFPSSKALGHSLSETRLSSIVGTVTQARLGVRITLHRLRDIVATQASETMVNGTMVAAGVLGHKSEQTSKRYYDHSEGRAAMKKVAALTAARRGPTTELRL